MNYVELVLWEIYLMFEFIFVSLNYNPMEKILFNKIFLQNYNNQKIASFRISMKVS